MNEDSPLIKAIEEAMQNPNHPGHRDVWAVHRTVYPGIVEEAKKIYQICENGGSLAAMVEYLEANPPNPMVIALLISESVERYRSDIAKNAADKRHEKPGGAREKVEKIRTIWRTGKYSSKDLCAEQECAALNMSFSAARRALRNV